MQIVTSYDSPDLDGIACSIAYAELQNKLGYQCTALYFGDLGLEVEFLKNYSNFFPVEKHTGSYDSNSEYILVDCSDPSELDPELPIDKIKIIFDHRQSSEIVKFFNAQKNIDLVGSCATLITEEFIKSKATPSTNSALYLYAAIVSNTINFKNKLTTQRDVQAASWLKEIAQPKEDFISQMFTAKSQVTPQNIYQILFQDFAIKTFGTKKIGLAQIEVANIAQFSPDLLFALQAALAKLKQDNNLDYIFFNGVDILQGYSIFYTVDDESLKFFSQALNLPDLKPGFHYHEIIMRKQLWPKVEQCLSNC